MRVVVTHRHSGFCILFIAKLGDHHVAQSAISHKVFDVFTHGVKCGGAMVTWKGGYHILVLGGILKIQLQFWYEPPFAKVIFGKGKWNSGAENDE